MSSHKIGGRGVFLHGDAREIIANVIAFMKNESDCVGDHRELDIPILNYKQRAIAATGISERMYRTILKESKDRALKAPKLDPEKPIIPKRPAEARDTSEVAKKLLKSGTVPAILPEPQKQHELALEAVRPLGAVLGLLFIPKCPAEARDALEVAKKSLKSRTIPEQEKQPEHSLKRPCGLDRKLISVSGYQAFSAVQCDDGPNNPENKPPKIENMYNADCEERHLNEMPNVKLEKLHQGDTICVFGYNITEDFLKKHFSPFGNIINISMEIENNRGLITFDKVECAERAISEFHTSQRSQ